MFETTGLPTHEAASAVSATEYSRSVMQHYNHATSLPRASMQVKHRDWVTRQRKQLRHTAHMSRRSTYVSSDSPICLLLWTAYTYSYVLTTVNTVGLTPSACPPHYL